MQYKGYLGEEAVGYRNVFSRIWQYSTGTRRVRRLVGIH